MVARTSAARGGASGTRSSPPTARLSGQREVARLEAPQSATLGHGTKTGLRLGGAGRLSATCEWPMAVPRLLLCIARSRRVVAPSLTRMLAHECRIGAYQPGAGTAWYWSCAWPGTRDLVSANRERLRPE